MTGTGNLTEERAGRATSADGGAAVTHRSASPGSTPADGSAGTAVRAPLERPAIRILGLSKRFGEVQAVDDLTLEVPRGRVFGFLGPNGAGKTTTIGMLLGLVHPSRGSVEVLGRALSPTRPAALRRVGSLVGAPALLPSLSARRNLELIARLGTANGALDRGATPRDASDRGRRGAARGALAERVDAALRRVALADAAHRRAGTFSTGMKQRLGLAMALVDEPELLILDEPTSGMDAASRREVRNLLREVASDGVTVFLSSHLLHEVEQVCDEVAVLDRGRLVTQGPVATLLPDAAAVRVRVDDPAGAVAALRRLPGARRVSGDGAYVEIEGPDARDVVVALVEAGHPPSEVRSGRPDLESLFLQLTTPENGAATGRPA